MGAYARRNSIWRNSLPCKRIKSSRVGQELAACGAEEKGTAQRNLPGRVEPHTDASEDSYKAEPTAQDGCNAGALAKLHAPSLGQKQVVKPKQAEDVLRVVNGTAKARREAICRQRVRNCLSRSDCVLRLLNVLLARRDDWAK